MRILVLVLLLSVSRMSSGAQCSSVFPNAIQSHSDNGALIINRSVRVNNLTSTVMSFVRGNINSRNGKSCGRVDCSVSGFAAEALSISGQFPSFNGDSYNLNGEVLGEGSYNSDVFGSITVNSGSNSFSNNYSSYFINNLIVQDDAVINLKPGTYWIKELILNSSNGNNDVGLSVVGSGTVYLYVNNLTVNSKRLLNGITDTAVLNIGAYGSVNFNSQSTGEGLIYALGDVTLNSLSEFTGVISSRNLTLNSNSKVNYVPDLFTTFDFSNTCEGSAPPSNQVLKYQIEHDGNALTCEAEPITIRACVNESCTQLYDQDITVNVSPNAGWPDGSTVTIPADRAATFELSQLTAGTVTLDVSNETTECVGTSGNTCDLVFADAGFQFIGADASSAFPDQIAESAFSSAQIRAVRTDNQAGVNVCTAALVGEQTLRFSMTCDDPSICQRNIVVGNSVIAGNESSNVSLSFDNEGVASLSGFSYADAGQLSLSAQATLDGAEVLVGETQFIVQPTRLTINKANQNAIERAGEEFILQLSAFGSEGNDALPNYQPGNLQFEITRSIDGEVDGVLTYAQSLTMSALTSASFQNTGISASTANMSNDDGVYSFSAEYSEFGQLTLDVRDSSYFNRIITSADSNAASPTALGTFIPAYFDVSENSGGDVSLSGTCNVTNGFTYLGQNTGLKEPLEYVVTAMNANGEMTQNYNADGLWDWLENASPTAIKLTDSSLVGTVSLTSQSLSLTTPNPGSRLLTIDDVQVNYAKSTTPYAPFSASMTWSFLPSFFSYSDLGADICYQETYSSTDDCDSATSIAALDDTNNLVQILGIDGTEFRWGRLLIKNGFGPETEDLLLAVSTEYFNGVGFIRNTDDSCTAHNFTASDFTLQDSNGTSTAAISVLEGDFGIVSGQTLGFDGIKIGNNDPSVMGEYRIELQPSGESSITWDDYLQFDWNGEDAGIGNPSAIISFGQFRGNDRVIHWREVGN